jgi:beta-lactamase regulating signal transducer with metallopeptidase domain
MNTLHLTSDIVRALGWSILHSLWQAFLVFACLKVVLKALPQAGARIKHNLSLISLAGIFVWFLATFYLHFDRLQEVRSTLIISGVPGESTGDIPMPVVYPSQQSWLYLIPRLENFFPYLVAIYTLGMLLMSLKLGSDLIQLQRIRTVKTEPIGEAWEKYVQKLAAQLQIPRKVTLLISHRLSVPVMLGFFKPVILVPIAMVNNLSESQLEAVLLHELAHIKRNDYLLNIFQSIVETILFFNPFIWLISRIIRIEREHCCDDLVIANTAQPIQYAHALVALAEYKLNVNRLTMAAANNKQHLFHRIKRIMEMKTRHLNYTQKFLAVLVIATGLISIAWLNPAKGKDNEAKQENKKQKAVVTYNTVPSVADPKDSVSIKYSHTVTISVPDSAPSNKGQYVTYNMSVNPPAPPLPPKPAPASTPLSAPLPPLPPSAPIVTTLPPSAPMAPIVVTNTTATLTGISPNVNPNVNFNYAYTFKDTAIDDVNIKQQIKLAQQSMQLAIQQLKNIDVKKLQEDIKVATAGIDAAALSKETMKAYEASIAALKNVNWNDMAKAQKEAAEALRKINIDSINHTIALALNTVNFDQISTDVNRAMNEAARTNAESHRAMDEAFASAQRADAARSAAKIAAVNAEAAGKEATAKSKKLKELVAKLEADKLLDSNKSYHIEKNGNELYINGVKQPDSVLNKYRSYFPGNEVNINGSKDNFNVNIRN